MHSHSDSSCYPCQKSWHGSFNVGGFYASYCEFISLAECYSLKTDF